MIHRKGKRQHDPFLYFLQASGSSKDPPQIVLGDKDGEDSEDGDIHDDDKAMEELIANPIEVNIL